jgi:hypothetical protein
MTLPLTHFFERILKNQSVLCASIYEPLTNERALLLLSRPVRCLANEMLILDFFGVFWIFTSRITGFFSTEDEAVQYAEVHDPFTLRDQ